MTLEFVPLGDLGQITQGLTPSRYASNQGSFFHVISVSDLESLCINKVKGKEQLNVLEIERYKLLPNDVVIAIRGSLLKSSVVTDEFEGSVSNQNTVFFRTSSESLNPLYLAILLRSGYFGSLPHLREKKSTTTLPSIKVSDVRQLPIPLPDLQKQSQIARLFLSVEELNVVTLSAVKARQRLSKFALFQALKVKDD